MMPKWFVFVVLLSALFITPLNLAQAQGTVNAWTTTALNLRVGPGTDYLKITTLPRGIGVILEARNENTTWVLGKTEDGVYRGWLSAADLHYAQDLIPGQLPVSAEIIAIEGVPAASPTEQPPASAAPVPSGGTASTARGLNVRVGPGLNYALVGVLPAGAVVILEARNADASWILGTQQGGTLRGWSFAQYFNFGGLDIWSLPVSEEIPQDQPAPTEMPQEPVDVSSFTSQSIPANVLANVDQIHQNGLSQGVQPNVFTTVGDSTIAGNKYTLPIFVAFRTGRYNLGGYGYLGSTVGYFAGSFGLTSLAANSGYSSSAILDAALTNPAICGVGENPLECEIRLRKPAVAIIYMGFGDLAWSTPEQFRANLERIVRTCLHFGVIPVLSTLTASEKMLQESGYGTNLAIMNASIQEFAAAYQVPLIDFRAAAHDLPNQGTDEGEGIHLSYRVDGVVNFNGDELIYGKDLRELLTLKVLDDLRRNVLQK
jgi:uncharacterized protein YraI